MWWAEAPAFSLPAILVPYPHAWRYQKVNADFLADRGAAVRLNDEQMEERLLPLIVDLLRDETRLNAMSAAAAALDTPAAADKLGRLLQALARGDGRWPGNAGAGRSMVNDNG